MAKNAPKEEPKKSFDQLVTETRQGIATLINNSGLPISVVQLMLENAMKDLHLLSVQNNK